MKLAGNKFILYGIIIILFVVVILMTVKISNDKLMNKWNDSINSLSETKNIKLIQIINYTPDGETKYDVESEKYNDYIKFMQSIKVTPCNEELLSGISTYFLVRYKDGTEFKVSFIGKYINVNDKYFYKIHNYNEVTNTYNKL
ncbi:MAG: hypothetical protein K2K89_08305 [Ruminococcus sp.]|nr:hypothetical protein [Ruminococcus sp.]